MAEQTRLLEIKDLKKYFTVKKAGFNKKQKVQAVDGVSMDIFKGETLGLVGESGCGKTTLGRTIIRLYEPTSGKIVYDGKTIFDSEQNIAEKMLPYRRKMQIIFQDPSASLDPRMTVGEIVGEALDIHKLYTGKGERTARINELLEKVNAVLDKAKAANLYDSWYEACTVLAGISTLDESGYDDDGNYIGEGGVEGSGTVTEEDQALKVPYLKFLNEYKANKD
jgi:ABC-type oligopeptide transport system ATPase subunit